MSPLAPGLRLALAASLLALAGASCQGADPYYRNRADGGGLGLSGSAGSLFIGGFGGFDAGSTAGTSGAAGGAGTAGTSGAAGGVGAGTGGSTGAAGTTQPCTTCMVKVQYSCRSKDTGQAGFVLDITNESSVSFPLSSLTLRYWYTIDAAEAGSQMLECDYAKLGCTNLVTSADTSPAPNFVQVMPPRPVGKPTPTANEYAEIAFKAGALSLDPFLDTGEMQLRLHNKDFAPIDQTDDYSFDKTCQGVTAGAVEWPLITAYLDGILVWGTEP